ncbi:hypothetical protein GCM10027418_26200 [Mariniluteicoccus endophyticus]
MVCTGNICRSPAGHLLLQRYLGDSVEVTSAGTHALVGQPVDPTRPRNGSAFERMDTPYVTGHTSARCPGIVGRLT